MHSHLPCGHYCRPLKGLQDDVLNDFDDDARYFHLFYGHQRPHDDDELPLNDYGAGESPLYADYPNLSYVNLNDDDYDDALHDDNNFIVLLPIKFVLCEDDLSNDNENHDGDRDGCVHD